MVQDNRNSQVLLLTVCWKTFLSKTINNYLYVDKIELKFPYRHLCVCYRLVLIFRMWVPICSLVLTLLFSTGKRKSWLNGRRQNKRRPSSSLWPRSTRAGRRCYEEWWRGSNSWRELCWDSGSCSTRCRILWHGFRILAILWTPLNR